MVFALGSERTFLVTAALAACAGCDLVYPYEPFEAPPGGADVCALHDADPGSCPATLRDCNGDPADSCETSVDSDDNHCGYCGHPCPEAGCADGRCDVQPLASVPIVLGVRALGVHRGWLYMSDGSNETKVLSLEGAGEAAIAGFGGPNTQLAFDGDFVYLASFEQSACPFNSGWCVVASPLGTGTASPLGATLGYPYALAVAPDHALFADSGDGGRIVRLDKLGGNDTTMATGQGAITHLACDDTHVYWAGPNGVARLALDAPGTEPEVLASEPAGALALTGGSLYWGNSTAISRMPAGGGEPEILVDEVAYATWIGVAGPYLYWAEDGAVFRRVLCPGGTNTKESPLGLPPAFVTAEHVYLTVVVAEQTGTEQTVVRRQH